MLKEHPKVKIKELQKTFMLMEAMPYTRLPEYVQGTQRKMVYTPDFIIEVEGRDKPIAMETKGHARGEYKMRKKLFIKRYGDEYDFYECKDKSDGRVLAKELPKLVGEGE